MWKSFKEDGVMETMVNGMQSLTTNIKYSKMTAKQYFHFIMSKEREDLNQLADILAACVSKDVLSTDIIMNVGFYFFIYRFLLYDCCRNISRLFGAPGGSRKCPIKQGLSVPKFSFF